MNAVQSMANRVGSKVGVDPTLFVGLAVALIQAVITCIKAPEDGGEGRVVRKSAQPKIVGPKEVLAWLNGEDGIFGTRWMLRRYRRWAALAQVSMYCASKSQIPNSKIEQIKEEVLQELDTMTEFKMVDYYVNAGIRV